MKRMLAAAAAVVFLYGCSAPVQLASQEDSISSSSHQAAEPLVPEYKEVQEPQEHVSQTGQKTFDAFVQEKLDSFNIDGTSQGEQARAAYEYIIVNTHFSPPVGLELWQARFTDKAPTYLQSRALSPLLFGVGECEDYAAALVILLKGMGMEALYMPGLTISVEGEFVDHAWVMAQVEGIWYHLDPQLEDDVTKQGRLTYRYFLKSDRYMLADHRWGKNLIDYGVLTEAQNHEVKQSFLGQPCPAEFSLRGAKQIHKVPRPNHSALQRAADEELRKDKEARGTLEPIRLELVPPVFGYEGYGNPLY